MTANDSAKDPSSAPFSTTMSARVAPSAAWISVSGRIRRVIAIATTPSLKAIIRSTLASRSCAIRSPSLSSDQLPPLARAKYRSRRWHAGPVLRSHRTHMTDVFTELERHGASIAEPVSASVSAGGVATVDWEGDADDEAGAWTAQPQHRCCNLVGAA